MSTGAAHLYTLEDNDAVIKMLKKARAPSMAHVARTHRVNLDWILERSIVDPSVHARYIDTSSQLADILTKPHFTAASWCKLLQLFRLGYPPSKDATGGVSHPEKEGSANSPSKKGGANLPKATTSSSSNQKKISENCKVLCPLEKCVDEDDHTKLLQGHSMVLTEDLAELRKARDYLHDLVYMLKNAGFYTSPTFKEMLGTTLSDIENEKF